MNKRRKTSPPPTATFSFEKLKSVGNGRYEWLHTEEQFMSPFLWVNETWGWRDPTRERHINYEQISNTLVRDWIPGFRQAQSFTDPLMRLLYHFPTVSTDIEDVPLTAACNADFEDAVNILNTTARFHAKFLRETGINTALLEIAKYPLGKESSIPMVIAVCSAQSIIHLAHKDASAGYDVWREFKRLWLLENERPSSPLEDMDDLLVRTQKRAPVNVEQMLAELSD